MKTLKMTIAALGLAFAATTASAAQIQQVVNNAELGLQALINSTVSGGSVNVQADQYESPEYWSQTNGAASSATFMLELTAHSATQTFGIYDRDSATYLEIFDGSDTASARKVLSIYSNGDVYISDDNLTASPGSGASLAGTINTDGVFGFYQKTGNGSYNHSDAAKNAGGATRMLAYQGGAGMNIDIAGDGINAQNFTDDDWILAFEDWTDNDFQDMVVNVSSITPTDELNITSVPVPATAMLFGLGLCGLGALRKRRQA